MSSVRPNLPFSMIDEGQGDYCALVDIIHSFAGNLLCPFSYASITQNLGPEVMVSACRQTKRLHQLIKRDTILQTAHAFQNDSFPNLVTKVGTLQFPVVTNIKCVIDFTVYAPSEKKYVIVLIYTEPKCVMYSCVPLAGYVITF
jgi:hypothetical protein